MTIVESTNHCSGSYRNRARDIAQKAVSFDEFKQITKFAEWAAIEEKFGR
jgi:hypothetical protein